MEPQHKAFLVGWLVAFGILGAGMGLGAWLFLENTGIDRSNALAVGIATAILGGTISLFGFLGGLPLAAMAGRDASRRLGPGEALPWAALTGALGQLVFLVVFTVFAAIGFASFTGQTGGNTSDAGVPTVVEVLLALIPGALVAGGSAWGFQRFHGPGRAEGVEAGATSPRA